MYYTQPVSGPGDGVFPPGVQHINVRNATAATAFIKGGVAMLDIGQTRVTNVTPGHMASGVSDSIFGNAILPTAAGIAAGYPIIVWEEAVAAGAVGKATLMSAGITAKVSLATDIALGAPLIVASNVDHLLTGAAGIVAWAGHSASIASNTATSAATSTSINVIFNGHGPRA